MEPSERIVDALRQGMEEVEDKTLKLFLFSMATLVEEVLKEGNADVALDVVGFTAAVVPGADQFFSWLVDEVGGKYSTFNGNIPESVRKLSEML